MYFIAVLSADEQLNQEIVQACAQFDDFEPTFLSDEDSFVHYLNYEIPEIDIIHYTGKHQEDHTLDLIKNDPWLHYGGSIVIFEGISEQDLSIKLGGVNVIAQIPRNRVGAYLPRVINVLDNNRNVLYQRDLHLLLQSNLTGSYVMENNPIDAATYSNLIANFLYNSNLIRLVEKDHFYSAMMELLINAIEHGNCRISSEEKTEYLAKTPDVMALIQEKNEDPEIAGRHIYLTYRITPSRSYFRIRDEGEGFDYENYKPPSDEDMERSLHGRGILMAQHYLEHLKYHGKGNEVSFELPHEQDETNLVPRVFNDQEEVVFEDGDVVFKQGDTSSHLYYIISGQFDIYANDVKISSLSSADIFLGEMSFLLNNRRSATVVSVGRGVCIRVSKEKFINSIKEHPHYGIFLARLLAQRLDQQHEARI